MPCGAMQAYNRDSTEDKDAAGFICHWADLFESNRGMGQLEVWKGLVKPNYLVMMIIKQGIWHRKLYNSALGLLHIFG